MNPQAASLSARLAQVTKTTSLATTTLHRHNSNPHPLTHADLFLHPADAVEQALYLGLALSITGDQRYE